MSARFAAACGSGAWLAGFCGGEAGLPRFGGGESQPADASSASRNDAAIDVFTDGEKNAIKLENSASRRWRGPPRRLSVF
jgi:hypothetical protein